MLKSRRSELEASLAAVADSRDRAMLTALVQRGDKLADPRPVRFVFWRYASDMRSPAAALDPLQKAAEAAGYTVHARQESSMAIEIAQALAPEMVNSNRALMLDWARRFKLDFRGWECQAVIPKRVFPMLGGGRKDAEPEPA